MYKILRYLGMKKYFPILFVTIFLSSCFVQSPKYAGVEQVLTLKTGMTKEEVSIALGTPPYDMKSVTDSSSQLIYKYRTTDRRTLSFFTKKTNGVKATGKWVDLFVTYDKNGIVKEITSCSDCEETKVTERRINYTAILQMISATVPAVLLYLGLK